MTSRNSSGASRVAGTAVPMPALLTRTSTRPNSSMASATRSVHDCGSATSVAAVERAAAGGLDEQRGVGQPVDAAGAEGHVGAGLGQALGEGDAQAAGGAGDDRDLPVESEQVGNGSSVGSVLWHAATLISGPGRARGRSSTRTRNGEVGLPWGDTRSPPSAEPGCVLAP